MKTLKALRSVIFGAFAILWTFVCFFLVTFALLFAPRGRASHWVVRQIWVAGLLGVFRVKIIVTGLENFERDHPYVFVSNHQSHFDIATIFHSTPTNLRIIGKQGLFYIPFFGWYLSLAGYIPLDRSNRDRAIRSHDKAAEKIRKGVPIVTFPEGTRSLDGSVLPFKKGAFMLALQAGVPIVPISITGSIKILPKASSSIQPGTIWIHYARPIDVSGYSVDDRDRLIVDVREVIIRNKAELDKQAQQQGVSL
ncbi:lysophospholipid acyltransferase family protein [Myxococcota bacterium]